MAESNRVVSRLMSFILLFDCQEAFHCCLVVACSNRINMISIQCHRVGEWSAGKPEFEKVSIPVWGNHDYAGLNEVHIPFKVQGHAELELEKPRVKTLSYVELELSRRTDALWTTDTFLGIYTGFTASYGIKMCEQG